MDGVGICLEAIKNRIEGARLQAQHSLSEQGRKAEAEEKLARGCVASRLRHQEVTVEGGEWLYLSQEEEGDGGTGAAVRCSGEGFVRSV